ncbi:MAG: calcium-binding protein, partial [Synechococcales bacterium]|nr:calcium-binding protein [Synechococcales bacterium]
FKDDGPTIVKTTNLVYANSSNPSPGGTGVFDYNIGSDARLTFGAANSDFLPITLNGTVGTAAITSPTVTWASETTTSAVFNFQFSYQADPASSTLTVATGTLTFDKVNDTYTVALTQPVSGFSVFTTSQALGFTGYAAGTSTIDTSQPDVSVAQLSNNFFVQFTGFSEPGGGTGVNNLKAVAIDADGNYVNGELFTQESSWVSVSNSANGVAGDTIQAGEVLDLDFFNTNPTGFTSLVPTTQATGIFLKFDGIGSEDLVMILKLVDPDDGSRTTKAIIIDNTDIFQSGSIIPAGYSITLDNNDGAVIIESNDYNNVGTTGENYLIEGAQLLMSTEDVTGTGINLNSATGTAGASTTFQAFEGTTGSGYTIADTTDSSEPLKIADIGFVTSRSGTLNTALNFNVAVVDADGDTTSSQTLNVGIIAGTTFTGGSNADSLQGTTGIDSLNGNAGNDVLTGNLGADSLTGGLGADKFVYNTANDGIDSILDFSVVEGDTIVVSKAGFGAGLSGNAVNSVINADQFEVNSVASSGSTRFFYNSATGGLFYDTDGSGTSAAKQLATLSVGLPLTRNNIFAIA